MKTKICIFKNEFNITEIIGRIKSKQFSLKNGHMYFDNTVVKIRYDLIAQGITEKGEPLKDEHIFDLYDNLLDLEKEECI